MICVQMVAYGRVMQFREAGKEKQRRKEEMNGINGHKKRPGSYWEEENGESPRSNGVNGYTNGHAKNVGECEESDVSTEDSEIIL